MLLSELIERAQDLFSQHGDLELLCTEGWGLVGLKHCVASEGEFPADWNMPAGFEFIQIVDTQ